jgi:hypothetical protein
MSKAKPLLFGAALGASAMFFALQYHVVQSHDGFQVVPRTPQQSIGLAYADIRNWNASQWTDRPELARALMAHGSSDLIAESVASSLSDKVSEDTSTLDELRAFLNSPDAVRTPRQNAGDKSDSAKSGNGADNDLFRIPFPQDPRSSALADPFRVAKADETLPLPQSSPVVNSRFSTEDVMEGLREPSRDIRPQLPAQIPVQTSVQTPAALAPAASAPAASSLPASAPMASSAPPSKSAAKQAQEMEDRIFGNTAAPVRSATQATTPKPVTRPAESESMFEEVKTQLENRAQEALNRAQSTVAEKADTTTENTAKSSAGYVREKASQLVPEAAKSLLNTATSEAVKSPTTPPLNFDPFLE